MSRPARRAGGAAPRSACALLLLLAACSEQQTQPAAESPAQVAVLVERIVAADEKLASRTRPNAGTWTETEDAEGLSGLRAAGPRALGTRLAARGDGAWQVSHAGLSVALTPRGARPAKLERDGARAIYRGHFAATDSLFVSGEDYSEQLLVLRDQSAPGEFVWDVALPAPITGVRAADDGGLDFVDGRGAAVLRMPAPYAIDAAGTRREASAHWSGGAIFVSLDTEGLAFPVVLDPAIETVVWRELLDSAPTGRQNHAVATLGDKLVLFGGLGDGGRLGDTWEWDGNAWTHHTPAHAPSPRHSHVMAAVGGKVVLFGGTGSAGYLADTWEWDGVDWTQKTPTNSPSARQMAQAAAFGSKLLLFGGGALTGRMADTWEWDGTNWSQKAPATSPPARNAGAMAALGAKVVLFGGSGNSGNYADTWEWDGTNWSQKAPAKSPSPRSFASAAATATEVLLFSGNFAGATADLWAWDGTNWVQKTSADSPAKRDQAAMAVLGGHPVLVGGRSLVNYARLSDLWEWNGSNWVFRTERPAAPSIRSEAALAPLGGKLVLFGGVAATARVADTWEWDGVAWNRVLPATSPAARSGHALATLGNQVVLFGGAASQTSILSDTWTWNGTSWTALSPATVPAKRDGSAMVTFGSKLVLFGGFGGVGSDWAELDDTWEWNGTNWTQRTVSTHPSARHRHAMAVLDGKVVLFGGYSSPTNAKLGDTWVWDGSAWTQLSPAHSPSARYGHVMFAHGGKVVLYGGTSGAPLSDTWEWDGSDWAQVGPSRSPPARYLPGAAPLGSSVFLFGGLNASSKFNDTWEFLRLPGLGSACTSNAGCGSGFCVDGVCCENACDGECQACSVAAGSSADGTCEPLPATTICRAADGECDVAETCDGAGAQCPADAFAAADTACSDDGLTCSRDVCDGAGACIHPAGNAGTVCRASAGDCDRTESCDGASVDCPVDAKRDAAFVCRGATGECDVAESCDGASDACPADGFVAADTGCTDDGLTCSRDVCDGMGTCSHPAGNAGNVCRVSTGDCDLAESCDGASVDCPVDAKRDATFVCRAATGECDLAENCDGSSDLCPADAFAAADTACSGDGLTCSRDVCDGAGACVHPAGNAGSVCRASTGDCDLAESCDGASVDCPADAKRDATFVCRLAAGECDVAENCDGASDACPADAFAAADSACTDDGLTCSRDVCDGAGACVHPAGNAGTVCRASTGDCDLAESCDGASVDCPVDAKRDATFVCRAVTGECDVAENCDGSSDLCPTDAFAAVDTACTDDGLTCSRDVCDGAGVCTHPVGNAGTVCRASAGDCDLEERCDGATVDCPADAKRDATFVCRAAAGECDVAESCDGANDACPVDGFLDATTLCRAASCADRVAIFEAHCTGSAPLCPEVQTASCGLYACAAEACGVSCATLADCAPGAFCEQGLCVPQGGPGGACLVAEGCLSGHCVDGVCCDQACLGQCEACDVTGLEGICSAVSGAPHGTRQACASDGSECGGACDGTRPDGCAYPDAATACRAASCEAGVATLSASCDAAGACPAVQTIECAPFVCGETVCRGDCALDADCAAGHFCAAGICTPQFENGVACAATGQCASGLCVDGVCCDAACEGQCEACDVTGLEGLCSPATGAPHGGRAACDSDGSACGGACDGSLRNACVYPGSTIECRAASCTDAVATLAAGCDGAGACPAEQTQACAPYFCGASACDGDCMLDADCVVTHFCAAGVCAQKHPDGEPCAGDHQCAGGICVDGVCCDRACGGQCEACDVAGHAGTCSPVSGAPHGSRPACASDGSVCGGTCDGVRPEACLYPELAVECRAASCADGVAILAATCDGAGACPAVQTQTCDPYVCATSACAGDCATDAECVDGHFCSAGVCTPRLEDGEACGAANQCASGLCVDGVCCDAACEGQCEACDVAGNEGVCSPVSGAPRGGRAQCAGQGVCQGQCDGAGRAGCRFPGSETECSPAVCSAGVAQEASRCDAAGRCAAGQTASCEPYACGPQACLSACGADGDCASGLLCVNGECREVGPEGVALGGGCGCTSGAAPLDAWPLALAALGLLGRRRRQ